jgi:hypothetical protein
VAIFRVFARKSYCLTDRHMRKMNNFTCDFSSSWRVHRASSRVDYWLRDPCILRCHTAGKKKSENKECGKKRSSELRKVVSKGCDNFVLSKDLENGRTQFEVTRFSKGLRDQLRLQHCVFRQNKLASCISG